MEPWLQQVRSRRRYYTVLIRKREEDMSVVLNVMTFRDGRTGEMLDKDAILSGAETCPAEHIKIKLDSNDSGGIEQATDDQIRWRWYVNQELDVEYDGYGNILRGDQAHIWGANGNSWSHPCYQATFKLHGGMPDNSQFIVSVETEHAGVVSNRISFKAH